MDFVNHGVKAIIHQSELDFVKKWILEYPDLETGGDFFGYWTEEGIPVIEFVIGPGRNARRTSTSFYQDIDYLKTWGKLINGFDDRLKHIGAWHSHHKLSLSNPSGGDVNTMRNALRSDGLSRFLISIGNINGNSRVTINGFLFIKDLPDDYLFCSWEVKDGISPLRQKLNNDSNLTKSEEVTDSNQNPVIAEPAKKNEKPKPKNIKESKVEKPELTSKSYWSRSEGRDFLKKTFDYLSRGQYVRNTEILQLKDNRIAISFDYLGRLVKIAFPDRYPEGTVEVILIEPDEGFSFFGNLFNSHKKIEKRILGLIDHSGVTKKNEVIITRHKQ